MARTAYGEEGGRRGVWGTMVIPTVSPRCKGWRGGWLFPAPRLALGNHKRYQWLTFCVVSLILTWSCGRQGGGRSGGSPAMSPPGSGPSPGATRPAAAPQAEDGGRGTQRFGVEGEDIWRKGGAGKPVKLLCTLTLGVVLAVGRCRLSPVHATAPSVHGTGIARDASGNGHTQ
jgi:hypothetical protein